MKKFFSLFIFLFSLVFSFAQSIYPVIEIKDSALFRNPKPAALGSPRSSSFAKFEADAWDTIANVSRKTSFKIFNEARQGNSVVVSILRFLSSTGNQPLALFQNGDLQTGNGYLFSLNGRISHSTTFVFASNSRTLKYDFANLVAPLQANGIHARIATGSGTGGSLSKALDIIGDGNLSVMQFYASGTTSSGTNNPSLQAVMDLQSKGRGFIVPRLTTAQRDGIPKRIATVTLIDSGAGFTNRAPVVLITNPVNGLPARVAATVAGGKVSALILDFGGTGYGTGGALVFDTTNTGATSMPTGSYTVTTDTLSEAMIIFNTDLGWHQYVHDQAWIDWPGGPGGSGTDTYQDVTDRDNVTTNDVYSNSYYFPVSDDPLSFDRLYSSDGSPAINHGGNDIFTINGIGHFIKWKSNTTGNFECQLNSSGFTHSNTLTMPDTSGVAVVSINGNRFANSKGNITLPTVDSTNLGTRINNAYTTTEKIAEGVYKHCKPNGQCDTVTIENAYKSFVAIITQFATDPPTAVILENDFGVTPTFSYDNVGRYILEITGAFIEDKTTTIHTAIIPTNPKETIYYLHGFRSDDDKYSITTGDGASYADEVIRNYTLEIRVYN